MSSKNSKIESIAQLLFVLGGLILIGSFSLTVIAKETGTHQIEPLFGKVTNQDQDVGELNQCAGTMEHYSFPATGYEPAEADAKSARGEKLYEKLNCKQCHSTRGDGGEMGPPLDGIGGHRGREWLIARLLDPEKQMQEFPDVFGGRPNIMPHIGASKKQAREIAAYLLTLPEPEGGFLLKAHPKTDIEESEEIRSFTVRKPDEATSRGRDLFVNMHCAACHSLDGSKSRFGPDLAGIGARVTGSRLEKILEGAVRSRIMKDQVKDLDEGQVSDLKAFLLSLEKPADKKDPN